VLQLLKFMDESQALDSMLVDRLRAAVGEQQWEGQADPAAAEKGWGIGEWFQSFYLHWEVLSHLLHRGEQLAILSRFLGPNPSLKFGGFSKINQFNFRTTDMDLSVKSIVPRARRTQALRPSTAN